jgi:hypothetical protein
MTSTFDHTIVGVHATHQHLSDKTLEHLVADLSLFRDGLRHESVHAIWDAAITNTSSRTLKDNCSILPTSRPPWPTIPSATAAWQATCCSGYQRCAIRMGEATHAARTEEQKETDGCSTRARKYHARRTLIFIEGHSKLDRKPDTSGSRRRTAPETTLRLGRPREHGRRGEQSASTCTHCRRCQCDHQVITSSYKHPGPVRARGAEADRDDEHILRIRAGKPIHHHGPARESRWVHGRARRWIREGIEQTSLSNTSAFYNTCV